MAEPEPMEGFICPICMTDFKTPTLLTKHFEEEHKDDPEILKSLKGLPFLHGCIISIVERASFLKINFNLTLRD